MNLNIYLNSASSNTVNKLSKLEIKFSFSGTLREDTELDNPIIEIEIYNGLSHYVKENNTDVLVVGTYLENVEILQRCNYANIPAFKTGANDTEGRYYFINKIEHVSSNNTAGIFRLYLHCDYLMSFRKYIYEQTALVTAQESATGSDLDYDTGVYKTRNRRKVRVIDVDSETQGENLLSATARTLIMITTSRPFDTSDETLFPSTW